MIRAGTQPAKPRGWHSPLSPGFLRGGPGHTGELALLGHSPQLPLSLPTHHPQSPGAHVFRNPSWALTWFKILYPQSLSSWSSVERLLEGKLLPNIPSATLLLDILAGNAVERRRAWFSVGWNLQPRGDKPCRIHFNIRSYRVTEVVADRLPSGQVRMESVE